MNNPRLVGFVIAVSAVFPLCGQPETFRITELDEALATTIPGATITPIIDSNTWSIHMNFSVARPGSIAGSSRYIDDPENPLLMNSIAFYTDSVTWFSEVGKPSPDLHLSNPLTLSAAIWTADGVYHDLILEDRSSNATSVPEVGSTATFVLMSLLALGAAQVCRLR